MSRKIAKIKRSTVKRSALMFLLLKAEEVLRRVVRHNVNSCECTNCYLIEEIHKARTS